MIVFKNVSKVYSNKVALNDVSLRIGKGEFCFIVGPSGAGKTTLVKMLYKEENPTKGNIYVAGTDLAKIKPGQVPYLRRKIGVVFQDFKLLTDRTVEENVAFVLAVTGCPWRETRKKVNNVLAMVGLKNHARAYPDELSGGEQQRVAIARALVRNPALLIADEPSGNLDPVTSMEIFRLLERTNAYGTTVVVATHAQNIVNAMRKRVIEIRKGSVIRDVRRGAYDS